MDKVTLSMNHDNLAKEEKYKNEIFNILSFYGFFTIFMEMYLSMKLSPSSKDIKEQFNEFMDKLKKKHTLSEWEDKLVTSELLYLTFERLKTILDNIPEDNLIDFEELPKHFKDLYPPELVDNIFEKHAMVEIKLSKMFFDKKEKNVRSHFWDLRKINNYIFRKGFNSIFMFLEGEEVESILVKGHSEFKETLLYEEYLLYFHIYLTFEYSILNKYVRDYDSVINRHFDIILAKIISKYLNETFTRNFIEKNKEFETNVTSLFYKNITQFRLLIGKQLKKSIFNSKTELFFKAYLEFLVRSDDLLSIFGQKGMYLWATDTYAILRMFKFKFDPKKHLSNDLCDNSNYFKNIIFIGGEHHSFNVRLFISIYFKKNFNSIIKSNRSDEALETFNISSTDTYKGDRFRCIEFSPTRFFN